MPGALSVTIPAPLGGWNARDSLDTMAETDAIRLVNLFPDTNVLRLRKGYAVHCQLPNTANVQTLKEHIDINGNRKLLACANGAIFDATTSTASSLATGFTENTWQTCSMKDVTSVKTILVNGVDTPQKYDGATISAAGFSGPADVKKLSAVTTFKDRFYFLESGTGDLWYGAARATTGAMTAFAVGQLFKRGGYPLAIGTWTRDTGTGSQDFLIIVSNAGEALMYQGDNPGSAATWGLVGRFDMPRALSARSLGNLGADCVVITEQGLIPFSTVISIQEMEASYQRLSDRISSAFTTAVVSSGVSPFWSFLPVPRQRMAIVNIPGVVASTTEQFVVNTLTGAWCRFTGIPAYHWAIFNDSPYFGSSGGTIFKFGDAISDNGAPIRVDAKFAFNYCNDREHLKKFNLARPLLTASDDITFAFSIDTDFQERQSTDTISVTGASGSAWDTSSWDTSPWDSAAVYSNEWYSVSGVGRCAALKIKGDYTNIEFSLSAINLTYEPGGPF